MRINFDNRGGAIIVSVIVIAGVALLLGIGRLAAFRTQVRLRLDREREIQQNQATRSALRWLETVGNKIAKLPVDTNRLEFSTVRGDIHVDVCPAPDVFPIVGRKDHFDLATDDQNDVARTEYDYVKGSYFPAGTNVWANTAPYTEECPENEDSVSCGGAKQFVMADRYSHSGDVTRVTFDLSEDLANILWSRDPYGRRYLVTFNNACKTNAGDRLVLGLTPRGEDLRKGSKVSEWAIWMEHEFISNGTYAAVSMYKREDGKTECLGVEFDNQPDSTRGLQMAGTYLTFVRKTRIINSDPIALQAATTFTSYDLGTAFCSNLVEKCEIAGGVRLTVDVDVLHERVPGESAAKTTFSRLLVTPAYEYQTILEWTNDGVSMPTSEVSTVVRFDPSHHGTGSKSAVNRAITYDTHGTYMNRKRQVRE